MNDIGEEFDLGRREIAVGAIDLAKDMMCIEE